MTVCWCATCSAGLKRQGPHRAWETGGDRFLEIGAETVLYCLRTVLRCRCVFPLLNGSRHGIGEQRMSAKYFDFFHRAVTLYQSLNLHRSFEVHLSRNRRVFSRNLYPKLSRSLRRLVGRSVISFGHAETLRAEVE